MDNNHNMPGQQNDKQEEQEYSLYTEKIVRKPGSRIKRAVKHMAKVVGSAVLFGVVAGLVLSVVYPTAKKFVGDAEPTTRQGTVIPTDSQTEEPADDSWAYSDTETGEPESSAAVQNESNYNTGESGSEGISGENGGNATENTAENADNHVIDREELESLVDDRIDHAFTMYKPGMSELDSLYSGLRTVINDVNKLGEMIAPKTFAWFAGIQYNILPQMPFTFGYSHAGITNEEENLSGKDYRCGDFYVSNLFYRFSPYWYTGIEYLHGSRTNQDNQSGYANRIQAVIQFNF